MLHASLPRTFARRFLTTCAAFALSAVALFAQTPSAADGFDPNVDGNVYAVATQADGKAIVAGQFSTLRPNGAVNNTARGNLARLNADGSVDTAFEANTNAPVRAVVIQSDGKILIGGDFSSIQPAVGLAVGRNRLARLNADGSIDTTFNPNLTGSLQPQVYSIVLQADGRILIGGRFTTVQPTGATAVTRRNLVRLNANGSVDPTFDPNPNGLVLAVALHVQGKILVGGGFTTLQPNGAAAATTRNRIARLNADGTVDTEFNPDANNAVTSLAVQRDGKILFGGSFTTIQPTGNASVANRSRLARLNVDGTLDSEFSANAGGDVSTIAVQPDGGFLVGGAFTSVWGRGSATTTRGYLARFLADSSVDTTFAPGFNAGVESIALLPDGKLIVGGYFTRATPTGTNAALIRNHVARVNANGTLDSSFELLAGGRPLASVAQADGKIVIGGSFTNVGGATHNYVARLNADGSVDATYNPDLDGRVLAMAYQSATNKVIVGGSFKTIDGESRNGIARLNPSGTIDSEFNPNITGTVGAIVVQPDGKILVGGNFNSAQPIGSATTVARGNILRLNADGTLDTGFNPNTDGIVSSMLVQSDGKIVLAGGFTAMLPNGATSQTARGGMARVNVDGTLDTAFNPAFDGHVSGLALQSDGKIIAVGTFGTVLPTGATTGVPRNRIARFNADGTLDTAFNPNANGSVLTVALQSDQKILIGGMFTTLTPNGATDWTLRKYVARLETTGAVDPTFNLDLNEQGGNRVDSFLVLADGRILVGGSFTSLQPNPAAPRVARQNFARINANGSLDSAFEIGLGGSTSAQVNAIVIQADTKVVVAGVFSDLGGARTTNLARFNAEGTPDFSFNSALSADGPINAVAVRPNGTPVPTQLAGFAWLNRNGTLRPGFVASANARLSGVINAIATQADGRLLLAGAFTNLTNATNGNLARFATNGTLDATFNPSVNGEILAMVVQSDGRIVIGGSFTLVNGVARNRIARLNSDGALDTSYDPNANGIVTSLALQSDGKTAIGGAFTSFTPNAATAAVARNFLARINADGTVDTAYLPNPNSFVRALAVQADGKIIAGGDFTGLQPGTATTVTDRNYVARLNADGSLDTNFNPNPNGPAYSLLAQSNGSIVIGGSFTALQPNAGTAATFARNNIARVGSDGAIDAGFSPNANGTVNTLAIHSDGAIVLGGTFTTLRPNGAVTAVARPRLARVNADGSLDAAFNPDVTGTLSTVAVLADAVLVGGNFTGIQPNGLLIVGGSFSNLGGLPIRNLALLSDDGSVGAFQPQPNGAVRAVAALADGRFIVGGVFTTIAGVSRNGLARFNADGSLDLGFAPNATSPIGTLALQSDGKLLVATGNRIARFNTDGSLDAGFAPTADGPIGNLAVQTDGRVVFTTHNVSTMAGSAGRFTTSGAIDTSFQTQSSGAPFTAVSIQTDGRIVLASSTVAAGQRRLLRLNADGSLDATFDPQPNGAVTALALQSDGRLMIGGSFTQVGGLSRIGLARLAATGSAIQSLGVTSDRSSVVWTRSGTNGEVSGVIFERSSDGRTWSTLGLGTRIAGTSSWQIGTQQLPATESFYIRARGVAASSNGRASSVYETVREFNFASPVIAVSGMPVVAIGNGVGILVDEATGFATIATLGSTGPVGGGSTADEITFSPVALASATGSARLVDISTRGLVSAETPLIAGFSIQGSSPRTVLLRGMGPSLAAFGVEGYIAAPALRLYDSNRNVIVTTSGWTQNADVAAAVARAGAFPFASSATADSATVITLAPGNYTMEVLDPSGRGGVALAEIYDAGTANESSATRLVNVSSRGTAGQGGDAFIGGFVISGDATKTLLVRGVGPSLEKFGVAGVLADPNVRVYDASGRLIAKNDDWTPTLAISNNPTATEVAALALAGANAGTLSSLASRVGAFALDLQSKDAALAITLPSGAYTVQVASGAGSFGTAMVEIYEVP